MYTKWTQHLSDPKAKADFEGMLKGSKQVLERQQIILQEEEYSLNRSEVDIRTFDQPNWEYRQAYKNGYRAALTFLQKLTDLDQQETK